MRAVVQRVTSARVLVNDAVISSIGKGLCVFIGISRNDTETDIEYIVRKLLNLRIFEDESGKRWSKSVSALQHEILCVSQFTLHAVLKGNKPDFHRSMDPEKAPKFYEQFVEELKKKYQSDRIKDGQFGAYMNVEIVNDGPVTITLDSNSQKSDDNE